MWFSNCLPDSTASRPLLSTVRPTFTYIRIPTRFVFKSLSLSLSLSSLPASPFSCNCPHPFSRQLPNLHLKSSFSNRFLVTFLLSVCHSNFALSPFHPLLTLSFYFKSSLCQCHVQFPTVNLQKPHICLLGFFLYIFLRTLTHIGLCLEMEFCSEGNGIMSNA